MKITNIIVFKSAVISISLKIKLETYKLNTTLRNILALVILIIKFVFAMITMKIIK